MADYVIRSGDTLTAIARRYGTTVQAIAQLNGISNPDRISAGATIRVPDGAGAASPPPTTAPAPIPPVSPPSVPPQSPSGGYTVRAGDTLSRIASQNGTSVEELARLNGISDPNRIGVGQTIQLPPQSGGAPLPRPNITRPNVPGRPIDRGAPMQVGRDIPGYVPEGWRPVPGGPADIPSPITPQMEAYAANPGQRSGITSMGTRGLPDLRAMSMPEFTQLRDELARVPSRNQTPGMLEAVEAESRRRVEALQAELARIDTSRGMQQNRDVAWQGAGETVRQNPPQPYNASIGEGEYLPQEQRLLMQLQGNQNANPQAVTSPQMPFRGGFQTRPQDQVSALIQALRSGGQGGQANNPMLMRLLQGQGR